MELVATFAATFFFQIALCLFCYHVKSDRQKAASSTTLAIG